MKEDMLFALSCKMLKGYGGYYKHHSHVFDNLDEMNKYFVLHKVAKLKKLKPKNLFYQVKKDKN